MKIALISTAHIIPTPPDNTYGGMERVNYWLARELVRRGNDVTLFGCKGSKLAGGRVIELPGGGEITPYEGGDYPPFTAFMAQHLGDYDLYHDSSHHHEFARLHEDDIPCISTIHNPNVPEAKWNNVGLSRFHMDYLRLDHFVYNGVPIDEMPFVREKEDYILYLGSHGHHKGIDKLLLDVVPSMPNTRFIFAGHIVDDNIRVMVEHCQNLTNFEYLGKVSDEERRSLVSKARGMLFYMQWAEPGSVAVIEAMAAGTPIIGSQAGVMPEYIANGHTGYQCQSTDDVIRAITNIDNIDPQAVYDRYVTNFTTERVADDYEAYYEQVYNKWQ